jgi:hypothetical protein
VPSPPSLPRTAPRHAHDQNDAFETFLAVPPFFRQWRVTYLTEGEAGMERVIGRWLPVVVLAGALVAGCGAPPGATPAGPRSVSAAPAAATATPSPETGASAAFACAPVSGTPAGAAGMARLTAVDTGDHEDAGYDRFVLRLSGVPSSFSVTPQSSPAFTEDASGRSVTLEGTAGVRIALHGVAGTPPYAGPVDIHPRLGVLREARQVGDFEGVVSWALGLSGPGCIRVLAPAGPGATTLVVDVSTR